MLGAASCGGNEETTAPSGAGQQTVATGQVPFDRSFIDAMVPHHQSAIDMAREALDAGLTQPELMTIANDIIATQQTEIDKMLAWREQWFGSKEPGPKEAALEELGMSATGMDGMEPGAMGFDNAEDVDQAFAEMGRL
ncbi:MAG TPA: DUF305 domain-containing protein [Gaiellaceae bacterium]|nr:DUF305 domain-containing protein [Gaiellaceae bacterium]